MPDDDYTAILNGIRFRTSHRTTDDAMEEYTLESESGLVAVGIGDTPIEAINAAVAKMEALLKSETE